MQGPIQTTAPVTIKKASTLPSACHDAPLILDSYSFVDVVALSLRNSPKRQRARTRRHFENTRFRVAKSGLAPNTRDTSAAFDGASKAKNCYYQRHPGYRILNGPKGWLMPSMSVFRSRGTECRAIAHIRARGESRLSLPLFGFLRD